MIFLIFHIGVHYNTSSLNLKDVNGLNRWSILDFLNFLIEKTLLLFNLDMTLLFSKLIKHRMIREKAIAKALYDDASYAG